jgi:predicted nucleic acid-binding protein
VIILDSSIFLGATLPDEKSQLASDILDAGRLGKIIVPAHFHIEVGNALTMNVRRGRITQDSRAEILISLADMDCDVEIPDLMRATSLADQFNLTLYDSAYLELAGRGKQVLATLDKKLAAAASALGLLHPAIASSGLSS